MKIIELNAQTKKGVLDDLIQRSPNNYSEYEDVVADIIADVKKRKDQAVFDYTLKFDRFALSADNIQVTKEEIQEAYAQLDSKLVEVIRKSAANIADYQLPYVQQLLYER